MKAHSGIIINNSGLGEGFEPAGKYRQRFRLPSDLVRGKYSPALTGLQVLVLTDTDSINFEWSLFNTDMEVDSGLVTEVTSIDGKGWVNIESDVPTAGQVGGEWILEFTSDKPLPKCPTTLNGGAEKSSVVEPSGWATLLESSLVFRVLADVADSGTDYLGNPFRSVVVDRSTSRLAVSEKEDQDKSWMSKPNPSKFAVESLHFDIRDVHNEPTVINRMLIDSITPGVYFSIYYNNDDEPGTDDESWGNRVWKRVPRNFRLEQNKTFVFPNPVAAKYVKVEFTHLQARHYAPGEYQEPIVYKKHPKWVLDYFYSVYLGWKASNEILSPTLTLRYDAFDLYYNYFVDDLIESADPPQVNEISIDSAVWNGFLSVTTEDELDQLDSETARGIRSIMDRFTRHPMLSGTLTNTLRNYAYPQDPSYSTEVMSELVSETDLVSTEDRESVLLDRQFPVMSFYMPSKHFYKVSKSKFENDRAYFVGIRSIVFERDHYASDNDDSFYTETAGDNTNVEDSDLEATGSGWTTRKVTLNA